MTVLSIPIAAFLSQSKRILLALEQEELVVDYAAYYILMTIPALYIVAMSEVGRKWLNCMRINRMPMFA